MSIQSQIERIQLNRDIIRAKMVDAGQASLNDDFDTLTENLTVYPIDNSLSNMSENPVQNKVIKGELDKAYKTDDTAETVLADADYIPFYDTSAGGKRRTLWSNVMAKLADTFQKKLTAGELISIDSNNKISSTVPTFANAFSRGDIIDTTERIVGMFRGKPMYQKMVDFGTLPNGAKKEVAHGIANIEQIVYVEGFCYSGAGGYLPIPCFRLGVITEPVDCKTFDDVSNSLNLGVDLTVNRNTVNIGCGRDRTNFSAYITLRYTKTTDTANAIKYGTGNDYSLDEQIVGTWIDGKPLYQKVVDYGALPNATYKEVEIGAGTIDVRNIFGYAKRSTDGTVFPIPQANVADGNNNISVSIRNNGEKIRIETGVDRSAFTECYITLQYTKTS